MVDRLIFFFFFLSSITAHTLVQRFVVEEWQYPVFWPATAGHLSSDKETTENVIFKEKYFLIIVIQTLDMQLLSFLQAWTKIYISIS